MTSIVWLGRMALIISWAETMPSLLTGTNVTSHCWCVRDTVVSGCVCMGMGMDILVCVIGIVG